MCVCVSVVLLLLLYDQNVCVDMHVLTTVCAYIYFVCVALFLKFFFQVQNELSQTSEKLHSEAAQRQQLTEEFEQVAAPGSALYAVTPEGDVYNLSGWH